jgi:hypothetical protein
LRGPGSGHSLSAGAHTAWQELACVAGTLWIIAHGVVWGNLDGLCSTCATCTIDLLRRESVRSIPSNSREPKAIMTAKGGQFTPYSMVQTTGAFKTLTVLVDRLSAPIRPWTAPYGLVCGTLPPLPMRVEALVLVLAPLWPRWQPPSPAFFPALAAAGDGANTAASAAPSGVVGSKASFSWVLIG